MVRRKTSTKASTNPIPQHPEVARVEHTAEPVPPREPAGRQHARRTQLLQDGKRRIGWPGLRRIVHDDVELSQPQPVLVARDLSRHAPDIVATDAEWRNLDPVDTILGPGRIPGRGHHNLMSASAQPFRNPLHDPLGATDVGIVEFNRVEDPHVGYRNTRACRKIAANRCSYVWSRRTLW